MNNPKAARRSRGRSQNRNNSSNGRRNGADGNRSETRVKGNAAQLLDKYKSLARDAMAAGDRVLAENYYQHADHYQRVLNDRQGGNRQHQADKPAKDDREAPQDTPDNIGNRSGGGDEQAGPKKVRGRGHKPGADEAGAVNGGGRDEGGQDKRQQANGPIDDLFADDASGEVNGANGATHDAAPPAEVKPRRRRRTSPSGEAGEAETAPAPRARRKSRKTAEEGETPEEAQA